MTAYRISGPGIFLNMDPADYFNDPCPDPSLTQSIAKVLLDRSPLHAWHAHPRLNPNFERDEDQKFNVANVAHLIMTGRGKAIEVIQADDWRTKAAKEQRDAAAAIGKLGILAHQYERAVAMVQSARKQLDAAGLRVAFAEGEGEVAIACQDDGLWLRAMVDWLSPDRRVVWDLKTTIASASPLALPTKMAADGWCIQAAMHERILDILDHANAGRRKHMFVCQECDEPYALTISEIPEAAMTMGRKQLEFATAIWRECVTKNQWPGYPRQIQSPQYPPHMESRWLEREVEADERSKLSNLMTAG